MTPSLQIAVAKAMGLACGRCKGTGKYLRYGNHEWFRICCSQKAPKDQPEVECDHVTEDEAMPHARLLPPLTLDLMWEAEEMLNESEWNDYVLQLGGIHSNPYLMCQMCCHAKPEQRAKTWLKVKGVEL